MGFVIGETVSFLYETGTGIIRQIKDDRTFSVEDEAGFERNFTANELVKIYGADYRLSDSPDLHLIDDKTLTESMHTVRKEMKSGARKEQDVWEIDLHIEEITESHRGLSNFQILTKQLAEFRSFFQRAKAEHISKIIVIHGVGEGVLKEEIRGYLSKQQGLEVYDADFREYGKGATAVEIHYNYK